jgi:hypothetical protein
MGIRENPLRQAHPVAGKNREPLTGVVTIHDRHASLEESI